MPVKSYTFHLDTEGLNDVRDLTLQIEGFLKSSRLANGILTAFVPGSTAAVTTIEFEQGAVEDLKTAIDRLAPRGIHYNHDARWGDGNGFAHVRAALIGPSLSVPFCDGRLQLGTWQQIVLIDFDNRPRAREVRVQIIGE